MEKLIQEVKIIMESEYLRACDKFGMVNNSDHESFAILLEEKEEADDEFKGVDNVMSYLWALIKRNAPDDKKYDLCMTLKNRAVLAACEMIQVAAMAHKAGVTIARRKFNEINAEKGCDAT